MFKPEVKEKTLGWDSFHQLQQELISGAGRNVHSFFVAALLVESANVPVISVAKALHL